MSRASFYLREALIELTGYYIFKKKDLGIGADLFVDLKNIKLSPEKIFDVGANIGQTALMFLNYFPKASVYCFEPVASTFHSLQRNVKSINSIRCFQYAIGEGQFDKEVKVFEGESSNLTSLNDISMNLSSNSKSEILKVVSGDWFCEQNNIAHVDLLKIDTEGYEANVIKGFKMMIEEGKVSAVYCEVGFNLLNRRHSYWDDINKLLYKLGFLFFGLYEINNLQIREGNNFGNALYIHNNFRKS